MTNAIPDQRPCTPLLDTIHLPNDLRRLHRDRLPMLASELRQFLLYTVGQTGGHLGAGPGVVELTLALQNLNVLFAIDRAGLVGEDGPTHHGDFDIACLRCIPNMVIMTPGNEQELWWMLNTAYQHSGPVAVRYPRGGGNGAPVEQSCKTLPFGKGHITRKGKDIALLAFGALHNEAMAAAEQLNATVVDMRFAKPLDFELLAMLADTHPLIVTVEDGITINGAGAGADACIRRTHQHRAILRPGLPDCFIHHQSRAGQLSHCGLDCAGIIKQITEYLER